MLAMPLDSKSLSLISLKLKSGAEDDPVSA